MCSGYRKGPDEDDGFWEVYNLYYRTHMVITLLLFIILVLWVPALYEFIMVLLTTYEEVDFFKNSLPKLSGCIDAYNVKEAIDKGDEKTFD